MWNTNQIMAGAGDSQTVATAVNGDAVVTLAAPGAGLRWLVLACSVSMSGDPAAPVSFTIVSDSNTLERLEFPAAACAPYNSKGMYRGGDNKSVVITLPALGSGIRGTVSVRATKAPSTSV